MEWKPSIKSDELDQYAGYTDGLATTRVARVVSFLLRRIEAFIRLPLLIGVPRDLEDFEGDFENMRAIRILRRLQKGNIVESFNTEYDYYPDEPPSKMTYVRLIGGKGRLGFIGKSGHLFERGKTLWPALGEAVERYALEYFNVPASEHIDASWKELKKPKLDIFSVKGFTKEKREEVNPMFDLQMTENSVFRWIPTVSLPSRKVIWAPLQLFSFEHLVRSSLKTHNNSEYREPLITAPISTGAATGQTLDSALLAGTLEVIERDAFIIYWLNQIPAKRVDLTSFKEERFDELLELAKRYRLEVYALYLETDMPVHTVCSVVIDRTGAGPAVNVGAKCGFNLEDVVYSSFEESLANRNGLRSMMEHNEVKTPESIYDMNHKPRMLHWFQSHTIRDIEHFLSGPLTPAAELPRYNAPSTTKDRLESLVSFISNKGYTIIYREIISRELKRLTEGLSVVMVRIPEMQPLYLEESLMQTRGERLREIPKLLGHEPANTFCTIPHPFP